MCLLFKDTSNLEAEPKIRPSFLDFYLCWFL